MKVKFILVILAVCSIQLGNAQKTKNLFNGKNLKGWVNHGEEKWFVENGELICESGPKAGYGYLSTKKFYKNFELTLEFKQENNGNSGVFIRSTVEGTKVSGWQVEVAPPGHATGGIYESYGRGWLIKPEAEKDQALKMGEWNTMKILVNGDSITTWLNGVEMVQLTDEKIGKGEGGVALQIHDGGGIRVKWRNIKLKLLK
ncbi:3-keto-disaccharide hydrolase [Flagellimonas sp.]|uniref:3-keto-disaccharide hydrolase n=1 Tax=Flagellimonas sp. TaxID=2058762 RepID=UPI003B50131C